VNGWLVLTPLAEVVGPGFGHLTILLLALEISAVLVLAFRAVPYRWHRRRRRSTA